MMTVTWLLTVIVTLLMAPETLTVTRVTLVQQQACTQAPDTARVVCRCPGELGAAQEPAYLGVRMQGFLIRPQDNQEVSGVLSSSKSCKVDVYLQSWNN